MIMLSSCCHTVDHVLPRIMDQLDNNGYPLLTHVHKVSEKHYHLVERA